MFAHLNIFQLIAIVAVPSGLLVAVLCLLDRRHRSDPAYLDSYRVTSAIATKERGQLNKAMSRRPRPNRFRKAPVA